MRSRKVIRKEIDQAERNILNLQNKIIELNREDVLLSDKNQWYTEKEEKIVLSLRPKRIETKLIGRVNWREGFKDEDTGNVIYVTRSAIVKINGDWVGEYRLIPSGEAIDKTLNNK